MELLFEPFKSNDSSCKLHLATSYSSGSPFVSSSSLSLSLRKWREIRQTSVSPGFQFKFLINYLNIPLNSLIISNKESCVSLSIVLLTSSSVCLIRTCWLITKKLAAGRNPNDLKRFLFIRNGVGSYSTNEDVVQIPKKMSNFRVSRLPKLRFEHFWSKRCVKFGTSDLCKTTRVIHIKFRSIVVIDTLLGQLSYKLFYLFSSFMGTVYFYHSIESFLKYLLIYGWISWVKLSLQQAIASGSTLQYLKNDMVIIIIKALSPTKRARLYESSHSISRAGYSNKLY